MALFVPNIASKKGVGEQWFNYLQDDAFVGDIKNQMENNSNRQAYENRKIAEKQSEENKRLALNQSEENKRLALNQSKEIRRLTLIQTEEQKKATKMICGSFENGINQLKNCFGQMSSMLDQRMTLMAEAQNVSNLLSENIALLMRIPDIQKERQYYIELGFNFFKNATKDPDLLNDALENLLKAEEIEKTDYIVLHRIGLIYLYSHKLLNLEKAEEYLRRAAKYSVVESGPDAARVANLLTADVNSRLSNIKDNVDSIKRLAAESYFHAGVSCYAQGDFDGAVELTQKAILCVPQLYEAGFMKVKALIALNKEEEAIETLKPVIEADPIYSIKAVTEEDLGNNKGVQKLLDNLHKDAVNKAKTIIDKCKTEMIKNSNYRFFISNKEKELNKNTYIDTLNILKEINNNKRELQFIQKDLKSIYVTQKYEDINSEKDLLKDKYMNFKGNVYDCIKEEKRLTKIKIDNEQKVKTAFEKYQKKCEDDQIILDNSIKLLAEKYNKNILVISFFNLAKGKCFFNPYSSEDKYYETSIAVRNLFVQKTETMGETTAKEQKLDIEIIRKNFANIAQSGSKITKTNKISQNELENLAKKKDSNSIVLFSYNEKSKESEVIYYINKENKFSEKISAFRDLVLNNIESICFEIKKEREEKLFEKKRKEKVKRDKKIQKEVNSLTERWREEEKLKHKKRTNKEQLQLKKWREEEIILIKTWSTKERILFEKEKEEIKKSIRLEIEKKRENIKYENQKMIILDVCDTYKHKQFLVRNNITRTIFLSTSKQLNINKFILFAVGKSKWLGISLFAITNSGIYSKDVKVSWLSFIESELQFKSEGNKCYCLIIKTNQQIQIFDQTTFVFFQDLQSALKGIDKYEELENENMISQVKEKQERRIPKEEDQPNNNLTKPKINQSETINQSLKEESKKSLKIKCSKCKQTFPVDQTVRGKEINCPHCNRKLKIPKENSQKQIKSNENKLIVKCFKCKETFPANATMRGKEISCPHCNQKLKIPEK